MLFICLSLLVLVVLSACGKLTNEAGVTVGVQSTSNRLVPTSDNFSSEVVDGRIILNINEMVQIDSKRDYSSQIEGNKIKIIAHVTPSNVKGMFPYVARLTTKKLPKGDYSLEFFEESRSSTEKIYEKKGLEIP